jgi:hypothetical protein
MRIEEAIEFVHNFTTCINPLFSQIDIKITDPIDVAHLPDAEAIISKKSGVYIIWSKQNRRVLYVGISGDIAKRIYRHIGNGFSWSKNGQKASFCNCTLSSGRSWLSEETKSILVSANWNITAVIPTPDKLRGLLESALIFYCTPELNVEI